MTASCSNARVDDFDRDRYRREKLARAERDLASVRDVAAKQTRLLGLAVEVAVGGTGCDPLALLAVLEAFDDAIERLPEPWTNDRVLGLLRETDPDRIASAA